MSNRNTLEYIRDEVAIAIAHNDAGGREQHAFILMLDEGQLMQALDYICSLNERIAIELEKK